jgi:AraC-like DNA-binding protein
MDAFSEILSDVKLSGALFFNAEFSQPWVFVSPASHTLAPALSAGAPHLVIYHLVVGGTASVRTLDGPAMDLQPGDVVVFPHGDPHVIGNGREADAPRLDSQIMEKVITRDLTPLRAGGGGEPTRFVCGYMACDPHLGRPVLTGLPPMLKVNVRTDPSGQWLESSILHLVEEAGSGRVGSEAMLAKLSEALFVDTLRRHIAALPEQGTGWLLGTRDPIVGKSLLLLHRDIARPWTIADLALAVGLSRSALVERFARFLSEPPMTYLTRWRLQVAARALLQTDKSLADISSEVGYESEAAFSRAFKRAFGSPPARYRRERRTTRRSQ